MGTGQTNKLEYENFKKELENIDFYLELQQELNKVTKEVKHIMLELISNPFWFEIGKALNSFPIDEKANKFKLKQKLESYMASRNYSDLDLDNELTKLEEKGYIHVKAESMPNYFCTLEFAQAVEIMQIIEDEFILPLAKELEKRTEFQKYKDLKRILELQVYSNFFKFK